MKLFSLLLLGCVLMLALVIGQVQVGEKEPDYYYIFKTETYQEPIVETVAVYDALNSSKFTNFQQQIKGYRNVVRTTKERTGAVIDDVIYSGRYNIEGGKISKWDVPIGDRNFDEFPHCLPNEIEKEICRTVELKDRVRLVR